MPPVINHIADANWHWEVSHVHGSGFTSTCQVRWYNPTDARATATIVADYAANGRPALPTTPSPVQTGPNRRTIDSENMSVIWRSDAGAGFPGRCKAAYVFDTTGSVYSPPYLANAPRLLWTDKDVVQIDELFLLFGFNFMRANPEATSSGLATAWLIPTGGGSPIEVPLYLPWDNQQRHTGEVYDYFLGGKVAAGTPLGNYNLYIYIGEAGVYGCAGPLPITVAAAPASPTVVNLSSYAGMVVGGDWSDALQAALLAAGNGALPAVVQMDEGVFLLSRKIVIPMNVGLAGVSRDKTIILSTSSFSPIAVKPAASSYPAGHNYAGVYFTAGESATHLFSVIDQSPVTDIAFVMPYASPNACLNIRNRFATTTAPFIARACHVENCRFARTYVNVPPLGSGSPSAGDWEARAIVTQNLQRSLIADNEFFVPLGIDMRPNRFDGLGDACKWNTIRDNLFSSVLGTWSMSCGINPGGRQTLFLRNRFKNVQRGIFAAPQFAPVQCWFIGNVFEEMGYRYGGSECIELEFLYANAVYCVVNAPTVIGTDGTGDYVEFASGSYNFNANWLKECFAIVISGPGYGQYREISQNATNRVYFKPGGWRTTPTTSSIIAIAPMAVENVFAWNIFDSGISGIRCNGGVIGNHLLYNVFTSGSGIRLAARDSNGLTGFNSTTPSEVRASPLPLAHAYVRSNQMRGLEPSIHLSGSRSLHYLTSNRLTGFGVRLAYNLHQYIGIETETAFYNTSTGAWLDPDDPTMAGASPLFKAIGISHDQFEASIPNMQITRTPRQMLYAPLYKTYAFKGITMWKPRAVEYAASNVAPSRPLNEIALGYDLTDVQVMG